MQETDTLLKTLAFSYIFNTSEISYPKSSTSLQAVMELSLAVHEAVTNMEFSDFL
jgi:hypothetical protein